MLQGVSCCRSESGLQSWCLLRSSKVVSVHRDEVVRRVIGHAQLPLNVVIVVALLALLGTRLGAHTAPLHLLNLRLVGRLHLLRVLKLQHFLLDGDALGARDAVLVRVFFLKVLVDVGYDNLASLTPIAQVKVLHETLRRFGSLGRLCVEKPVVCLLRHSLLLVVCHYHRLVSWP